MATTFSLEVNPRMKKDGTYSCRVRVYHNGQKASIPMPYVVEKSHLKRNSFEIKNADILADYGLHLKKWQEALRKVGLAANDLNVAALVDLITNRNKEDESTLLLSQVAKQYLNLRRGLAKGTMYNYSKMVLFLERHCDTPMKDMSIDWVDKIITTFDTLKRQPKTAIGYMNFYSTVCSFYEEKTYYSQEFQFRSPFHLTIVKDMMKALGRKAQYYVKRNVPLERLRQLLSLTVDDIKKQRVYVLNENKYAATIDLFKISAFMQGANIVDICNLSKENISADGEYISYIRTKLRSKGAREISVKITPELHEILDRRGVYKGRIDLGYEYVKNAHTASKIIAYAYPLLSAAVGEKVCHYTVRKTLATLIYDAEEGLGYSEKLATNFLSHSVNQGVTGHYIDPIQIRNKNAKLNRQLLDLILYDKKPALADRIF